jgi:predicted TIM-barrel fold metal-dependent hydrolase
VAVNGHLVVDVDAHYLEPIHEMTDFIAEPWRSRLRGADPSRWIPVGLGDRFLEGRIKRDDAGYAFGKFDYGLGQGVEKATELRATMQRIGVDAAVLVPNRIVQMGHVSVRDLVVALNQGFIRYMLERVCDPAQGVYTMVVACWQDPVASAELIHEVADDPAVAGVCLMSAGANPSLGDVCYDPIYQAAQECGLPVVFHSAPGLNFVEGSDYASFQRLIESHSLGFAVSNQIQLTSVLLMGVPERFPKLSFVFEESGLFWVPMMMYRLDEYYLKRRSEAPLLTKLPSEYIRERFYFGTQPIEAPRDQRHLEAVFDAANGRSQFLFASDYPHFDYDDPSAITRLAFLTDEEKAAVFAGNALRVFPLRKGGVQPWESTSPAEPTMSPTTAG